MKALTEGKSHTSSSMVLLSVDSATIKISTDIWWRVNFLNLCFPLKNWHRATATKLSLSGSTHVPYKDRVSSVNQEWLLSLHKWWSVQFAVNMCSSSYHIRVHMKYVFCVYISAVCESSHRVRGHGALKLLYGAALSRKCCNEHLDRHSLESQFPQLVPSTQELT